MSNRPCHRNSKETSPIIFECKTTDDSKRLENLSSFDVHFNLNEILHLNSLNEKIRAKIVDWMIEILHIYKTSQRTVYLAVRILDIYLAKTSGLGLGSLQLVSLSCMFIASKYEDVYPLTLDAVCIQIAHSKISKNSVRLAEKKILASQITVCSYLPFMTGSRYIWISRASHEG